MRGVGAGACGASELHIIQGRIFTAGRNEIIVGRAAAGQFVGLTVGSTTKWGENTWEVVGIFERQGRPPNRNSGAMRRSCSPRTSGGTATSRSTRDSSARTFDTLKDALTTNPQLSVTVIREPEYYAAQSDVSTDHQDRWIFDRRPDGHWRDLRRGQHDVQRRWRQPHPRDRDPAGARFREHSRSSSPFWRKPSPLSLDWRRDRRARRGQRLTDTRRRR